jgi:hypothetical protein
LHVLVPALCFVLIVFNHSGRLFDVIYAKGMFRDRSWVEFAKWNAISRVEVDRQGNAKAIVIDADASTSIMNTDPHSWGPGGKRIQRFVLFLGHPTYALTVVIFLLLLSSDGGSLLSRRWLPLPARVWVPLLLLVGATCAYVLVLPALLNALVGLPFAMKLLVGALILIPLGLAMGMPFPTGLRALARLQHQRWFRSGQKWRTGSEGRISVLKRRHGLRRCLYPGLDGMRRWVGLGVIADNVIQMGCYLARQST